MSRSFLISMSTRLQFHVLELIWKIYSSRIFRFYIKTRLSQVLWPWILVYFRFCLWWEKDELFYYLFNFLLFIRIRLYNKIIKLNDDKNIYSWQNNETENTDSREKYISFSLFVFWYSVSSRKAFYISTLK